MGPDLSFYQVKLESYGKMLRLIRSFHKRWLYWPCAGTVTNHRKRIFTVRVRGAWLISH